MFSSHPEILDCYFKYFSSWKKHRLHIREYNLLNVTKNRKTNIDTFDLKPFFTMIIFE